MKSIKLKILFWVFVVAKLASINAQEETAEEVATDAMEEAVEVPAAEEVVRLDWIAFDLQRSMTKLADIKKTHNSSTELVNAISILEENENNLFKQLNEYAKKTAVDSEYLKTLKDSQIAIEDVVQGDYTLNNQVEVINAVAKDYEVKLRSVAPGFTENMDSKVRVIVKTIGGEGYSVFGKYCYDLNRDIVRFQFNNPTNNAEKTLPTGYYIFWIAKDGEKQYRNAEITKEDNTIQFNIN